MNTKIRIAALAAVLATGSAAAQAPELPPGVTVPKATVPEVMTLQGQYVRTAYNNEGFVNIGYRVANSSVGEEWMLLDAGMTLRQGVPEYKVTRDAFAVKTPDGKLLPLATQSEYADARYLPGLNARAKTTRDSISYFPLEADQPCSFQFFTDLGKSRGLAHDEFNVTHQRACVGRLFFRVPGGIQTGQHWLVVKLPSSRVEVPFRIFTKEEEKVARKKWQDFKKALDEGLLK